LHHEKINVKLHSLTSLRQQQTARGGCSEFLDDLLCRKPSTK